jgi:hypothetical protein
VVSAFASGPLSPNGPERFPMGTSCTPADVTHRELTGNRVADGDLLDLTEFGADSKDRL